MSASVRPSRRGARAGLSRHVGLAFIWLAAQLAHAAAGDDAEAVVERLHSALIATAAIEPAPELAARYAALAAVVTETHDLQTMGRLTVRRYWRNWSESERASFVEVFTRLSITTYASRFASIGPGSFEILASEVIDEDRVDVKALIHRKDGDDVPMDYTLRFDGADWRIINVLADGASELSLMASEYYAILETGGLDELVAELETRIAEL